MGRASPHARLARGLLLGLACLLAVPASAQSQGLVVRVERDGTLGSGPLEVGPGTDPLGRPATYLISPEMGEQRGRNLFHSFRFFGVGQGETATFTGPDPIEGPQSVSNVISRVTGGTRSEIDGTLRSTIPGASVWLFNPSGFVFGEGSEIDVKGSFHAATADYLAFAGTDERFHADRSRSSVLSTAPPAAFGFLPESDARGLAVDGSTLEVPEGETLELVGRGLSLADAEPGLSLTGAELLAPGGHVGLEAQGEVALSDSLVDVGREGKAPGTISIRGGQVFIQDSKVLAENESPLPTKPRRGWKRERPAAAPLGSIAVAASESVLVDDSLLSVNTRSAADAGTIHVASPVVTFQNGPGYDSHEPPPAAEAGASAETTGSGAAGEIQIHAGELVTLTNGVAVSATAVGSAASGDAGSVEIEAHAVVVEKGARVSAEAVGAGAGGSISIGAEGSVDVNEGLLAVSTWSAGRAGTIRIGPLAEGGPSPDVTIENALVLPAGPVVTAPGVRAETTGTGAGGEIQIDANKLAIQNGGIVSAGSRDLPPRDVDVPLGGDAGSITIVADSVHIGGLGRANDFDSSGSSQIHAFSNTTGRAGKIDITSRDLTIQRGGFIIASNFGAGGAGTIKISASESILLDGLSDEIDPPGATPLGIFATNQPRHPSADAKVTSGRIHLVAPEITLTNGAIVRAATFGGGAAGDLLIEGQRVRILNRAHLGSQSEGLHSGNAGTIEVHADTLEIEGDGKITASTSKRSSGDAGHVVIEADTVKIREGGEITAVSVFGGDAGTIQVTATDSIVLDHGETGAPLSLLGVLGYIVFGTPVGDLTGIYSSTVGGGRGGPILLDAPEIKIANGAFVSTTTVGGGDAGHISLGENLGKHIHLEDGGFVDSTSLPLVFADLPPPRRGGAAGEVTLVADERIEVTGRRPVTLGNSAYEEWSRVGSTTLGSGAPGTVTLDAPRIVVDGGAVATTAVAAANGWEGIAGGDISLVTDELVVRDGGRVDASSFITGAGGTIHVDAGRSIVVQGAESGIASRTGGAGTGGDIGLLAPVVRLSEGGEVSATSERGLGPVREFFASIAADGLLLEPMEATGNAGSIALAASRLVHLDAGAITTSSPRGQASGGDIAIDPLFVILQGRSQIVATADQGQGGRIRIAAENLFQFPGSRVSAASGNPALSGTVEIKSPDVNLAGTLAPLPSAFLDAASLMRERCAARRSGERAGSFSVRGAGGIPAEPDGWLRAPVVLADATATAAATPAQPALFASLPRPLLAHGACP